MVGNNPAGQEFFSIVTLTIRYQERIRKIDPKNPYLKYALTEEGRTASGQVAEFTYPPEFGERFKGLPINQAVYRYYGQLEAELRRLEAKQGQ